MHWQGLNSVETCKGLCQEVKDDCLIRRRRCLVEGLSQLTNNQIGGRLSRLSRLVGDNCFRHVWTRWW